MAKLAAVGTLSGLLATASVSLAQGPSTAEGNHAMAVDALSKCESELALQRPDDALRHFEAAVASGVALPELHEQLNAMHQRLHAAGVSAEALAEIHRKATSAPAAMPEGMASRGVRRLPTAGITDPNVQSMGYVAGSDQSNNQLAGAQDPAPAGRGDGNGLFQQGMAALESGQREEALRLFNEAWRFQADLDQATRQQLREKLMLLRPEPIGTPEGKPAALTNQQIEARQRLSSQVAGEIASANQKRQSDPLAALEQLRQLERSVQTSTVDEAAKAQLAGMVGRAIVSQQTYVNEHRADIDLDIRNDQVRRDLDAEARRRQEVDDKIAQLVNNFNQLIREYRYEEAERIGRQVRDLDPGSPIAELLYTTSLYQSRIKQQEAISENKGEGFVRVMRGIDSASTPYDGEQPLTFADAETWSEIRNSAFRGSGDRNTLSPADREIMNRMEAKFDFSFTDRPLVEVCAELQSLSGIMILLNERSLSEIGMNPNEPVTLKPPTPISLKSALKLISQQLDLAYSVHDEAIHLGSIESQRESVVPRAYPVGDLCIPVPNFIAGYEQGLAGALSAAYQNVNRQLSASTVPMTLVDRRMKGAPNLEVAGNGTQDAENVLAQFASANSPMLMLNDSGQLNTTNGLGGGQVQFTQLINLITSTIAPDSWDSEGGSGTITPNAGTLSLIISQTSDVHDQIADLLQSLRELQNLQVTIEVRFITLSDSFFERIGVDFDFDIDDNNRTIRNDDSGRSQVIGIRQNGAPTADWDIRFTQDLFTSTRPQFGGFDVNAASTLGFAILSDIEAFFFIEALQGDSRTNVLQAPKVTLFDGQIGNISDFSQRPFVTGLIPIVGDFAVAQQPVIVVLNEGTQLNVQAVVSNDKRFVRLTLVPMFTQIGDVSTFTFEGTRTTRSGTIVIDPETGEPTGDREDEEVITSGSTVQLPTFAQTSVSTTVNVPDGGTILLGGIKRLNESRVERGVPLLSKLPYINRLFRNVGIGREATSLMLMVTPRIIIPAEEEEAQTGYNPNR
jgi:general secretion pathway protein D